MANTVTLTCQRGQHTWERISQRGRRPSDCPEHQAPKAPSVPLNAIEREGDVPCEVVGITASERVDRLMDMLNTRTRFGNLSKISH